MRRNTRIIRDKNVRTPERYKKIDTTVNGDAERLMEEHREIEKRLYPLRIDHRTIIYVTKDKCTPEYAAKKREKLGLAPVKEAKDLAPKKGVRSHALQYADIEKVQEMINNGMKSRYIAREMGVAESTMSAFIRRYGLKNKE